MGRLREFRRKLDEIQRRRDGGRRRGAESGAPDGRGARAPGWSPFLRSALERAGRLPRIVSPSAPARPAPLEEVCAGEVLEAPGGGVAWVMRERDRAWEPTARALVEAVSTPGSRLRRRLSRYAGAEQASAADLLFFDIETTGLGSTPLFLIGTMAVDGGELAIRQYLARDYAEEIAVLRFFLGELASRRILVSFNGKSFDLPYIRVRLSYHRQAHPAQLPHYDVLLDARRVWRGEVPDCRLTTLERLICAQERVDDIDGARIPDAYHRFVRTGDASEIALVVRHNRRDLLTMAELMLRMPSPPD